MREGRGGVRLHLAFSAGLAIGSAMSTKLTTRLAQAALAAATLATLSACAGGTEGKDVAYVARDVESLYAEAQRRLDRGNTLQAAALFDEVERQHPYSPWAQRAMLMSAMDRCLTRRRCPVFAPNRLGQRRFGPFRASEGHDSGLLEIRQPLQVVAGCHHRHREAEK